MTEDNVDSYGNLQKFCPDCKVGQELREFVIGGNRSFWVYACDCATEREKREQGERERIRQDEIYKRIIPLRFYDANFVDSMKDVSSENKKIYEKILGETERIKKGEGNSLFLFGSFGTGKTHLTCCIAREIYFGSRHGIKYYSTPQLLESIRKSFNDTDTLNPMDGLIFRRGEESQRKKGQVLFIDDIGKEKPSEWVSEQLYILINNRYENLLSTVLTSNCTAKTLENNLGKAIVSRIYEMCTIFALGGDDRRRG